MKVSISGVGSSLVDYLFADVSFTSPPFADYTSKNDGDGGLSPGKLVFTDDFAAFTGADFADALDAVTGGREPDALNMGGPAIIALANAAQLSQRDEVEIAFYGAFGSDEKAEVLLGFLDGIALNVEHYRQIDGTTPFTYVFSDPSFHDGKGERAFVNNIGVGWDYGPDAVPDEFYAGDILLYGATALVPGLHEHLTPMLRRGRESGKINVVTTVYDFLNERKAPLHRWPLGSDEEGYPFVDLLVADLEEAIRLSGAADQQSAAAIFASRGVGATVITNGSHDIHVQVNGGPFKAMEPSFLPVCRAVDEDLENHPELIGDTTGCGDNFAGGILYSMAEQLSHGIDTVLDIVEAVAWGAASGGFARFSLGGLFTESEPGEKLRKVCHYRSLYRQEIGDR